MRSRLEDLIVTADRQLASRSFDAAIDTLRTASSEPGAAEAGVEERLESAYRARDEALGIERPAPPPVVEIAPVAPVPLELPVEAVPVPQPIAEEVVDDSPIEPPKFQLMEDEPFMIERPEHEQYPKLEVERLSILHPNPAPEPEPEVNPEAMKRVVLAAVIALVVVLAAFYLR